MQKMIINADDFGMFENCTKAIIKAFNEKKITSTTLCANGYYFDSAIDLVYQNKLENKVGIHLNLTEGMPVTENIRKDPFFCDADGRYHGNFSRINPLTRIQRRYVFDELTAQIERIRKTGIALTHADSHHHMHICPNITHTFISAVLSKKINKIRICRNIGPIPSYKYLAKKLYNELFFRKKFITTDFFGSLQDFKSGINIKSGSLEIMVHPDFDKDQALVDRVYDADGKAENESLTIDENVTENYELCSFNELNS